MEVSVVREIEQFKKPTVEKSRQKKRDDMTLERASEREDRAEGAATTTATTSDDSANWLPLRVGQIPCVLSPQSTERKGARGAFFSSRRLNSNTGYMEI